MAKSSHRKRTARPVRRTRKESVSRPSAASLEAIRDKTQYVADNEFEFFDELRALILKPAPAERDSLVRRISRIGRVRLAVIAGILVNESRDEFNGSSPAGIDLFVVADEVNRVRLNAFLKSLEAEVGKEIRFGIMEKEEFDYRYNMFDRFVRVLLEGPHEKIINKLGL